ncbi:MAG: Crp/Fnr family transcriptional regulator [Actinomycetota bacterium]
MNPVGAVEMMATVPLFSGLPKAALGELGSSFRRKEFPPGAAIFRQGDPGGEMLVIFSGRVKIETTTPRGRRTVVALLGPGDLFGELSLIDGAPRMGDAVCMDRVEAWSLSASDFYPCLEAHPELASGFLRILASRLRDADAAFQDIVFLDIPARVAKRLLELAESHGTERDGAIELGMPLTQGELAKMVGASRERVNRALAGFAAAGLVEAHGRRYTIRDVAGLRAATKGPRR